MKWYRPPAFQWYNFLASMPVIDWLIHLSLFGDRTYHDPKLWFLSFPLVFLMGMGSWYMHYQYDHFIWSRYPSLRETSRRVKFKLLVNLLVMTPSVLLILLVYHAFHLFGYHINGEDVKWCLLIGVCVNLIFETLWETVYILDRYKDSLSEKELIEQMRIQQEFDHLKGQVNPHFLFNCFNTLSSLISEDREQAEFFLNELSKVYRYLLRANEGELATLEAELRFIDSYCRLLKTRHGEGFQVRIEVDRRYHAFQVPSLSLQLVVENAVKHNIVSKQQPLQVDIFTTPARALVVNNNLQRRKLTESSTRIGLQNIRSKYKLLRQEGFEVVEEMGYFRVVLPLILPVHPDEPAVHT